jgi:hypothetical protein
MTLEQAAFINRIMQSTLFGFPKSLWMDHVSGKE